MTDENDFEALLREHYQSERDTAQPRHEPGARVKGRIIQVGSEQVFVDLGGKAEAVMDIANFKDDDGNITATVGDSVEAVISGVDPENGSLILGSQHGRHLHGTAELEDAYRQGTPVEGQITGAIKGGLEVQVAGHRAFCPASQVDIRFVEDLATLVGQRHSFRITKYEGGRRLNLVVSRRALLEEEQRAKAAEIQAKLEPGAVLQGTVTALKDYGAFVDLGGGIEGMVHISELAFGHVKHPEEILSVGQQIEVAVLRIEQTNNPKRPQKVALSIRALAKDPWTDALERFPSGARATGKVTRLQPFGAFVELAPGLEGMIHISELGADRRINHPEEVLSSGQQVEAVVLQVDPQRRRIALSLNPDAAPIEPHPATREPAKPSGADEGLGTLGELLKAQMEEGRRGR